MDGQTFEIPKKLPNYDLSSNAVGIDFGTTECCAAVIRKNGPEFVVLDPITRLRTMPSFIAFDEEKPTCGQVVIDRMRYKAEHTVYDIKRILGKNFDEIVVDPIWPFKVVPKNVGTFIEVDTHCGKRKFESEQVAGDLLLDIKKTIEGFENQNLTDVVISIPSEITEKQKMATKMAAEYAGWKNIHFIPEPVAAAFAYFDEMPIPNNSNILICVFGGGTVDICIAKVVNDCLNILICNGDSYLGGRDFDAILFNHFASTLTNKHGINLTKNNKNFILKRKCQDIKHNLSVANESWLDVSDFDPDSEEVVKITQKEFETMTTHLIVRTKNVLIQSVSKANLQKSDINIILQVGGGCRMPMIKKLLIDIFPNANHRCSINPDWIVTHGAAVYAYHLKTEKSKTQEMIVKFATMSQTDKDQSNLTNKKHDELQNRQSQNDEKTALTSQNSTQTKNISHDNADTFKPNTDDSPEASLSSLADKYGGQSKANENVKYDSSDPPDEIAAIVIDNGSSTIRAGFAGDDCPRVIFPTVVGRPKYFGTLLEDSFVGNAAQENREKLDLTYPIERGYITNMDDMEKIWHHVFYKELKVVPEEHPVLMTDASLNAKPFRERMTQIMFEKFNTPAFYVEHQEVLSLYASGRTTGLVLSCGEGATFVVPFYDGYDFPHATYCLPFGGGDATDYLVKILGEKGYTFPTSSDRENVREMKEKLCYVAQDFHLETSKDRDFDNPYTFPNGRCFMIENERFKCPEIFFNPAFIDIKSEGVHKVINEAITKCDAAIQKEFYGNIVLAGGSSMFPGFGKRLKKEITSFTDYDVNIIAPPDRKYSAWMGGSIVGSLLVYKESWITKPEYDEEGPSVVHRKCF